MSKTIKEQLEPVQKKADDERHAGQARAANAAIKADAQLQKQAANPEAGNAAAFAAMPITAERVDDNVVDAVQLLSALFYEPEQRQEADNGYFYRLDYDGWDQRDDGAQPTGNIVVVDRFAFLGGQVVRGLCSSLDYMLNAPAVGRGRGGLNAQANGLRTQIRNTVAFAHNQGVDMSSDIDELAGKLERVIEQATLVEVALKKAVECYHKLTGRFYQTTAQRTEAKAAAAKAVSSDPRLAGLGV